MTVFSIPHIATILITYHTDQALVIKVRDKERTPKTKQFSEETKWMDWKDYFDHFLCTQPGINGVILKCVIRYDHNPIFQANVEFLDDYIN